MKHLTTSVERSTEAMASLAPGRPSLQISMIGTRGVPAHYGGFETAVEEVGARLVERGHDVVVYCRGSQTKPTEHKGMQLVHLPAARAKQLETLSHSFLSTGHRLRAPARGRSVALVFNAANALFVPLLRRRGIPTVLHVDGLEWKRGKWGPIGRQYYLASERLGVRVADALIADARTIQDYYQETYDATSSFIPYGAPTPDSAPVERLRGLYGVRPQGFYLIVARMEPENHVLEMVRGYAGVEGDLPLLVVGGAPYASEYQRRVAVAAAADPRVRLLGSLWDQQVLDALYANCAAYLHGHSVGGTNPSLLRAMGAGTPVVAIDVAFNREVLGDAGAYFGLPAFPGGPAPLPDLRGVLGDMGVRGRERAHRLYDWDTVALQYESLCFDVLHAAERRAAEGHERTRLSALARAVSASPSAGAALFSSLRHPVHLKGLAR